MDKHWNVRPNGRAWLDLVKKQWWTDTTDTTDATGTARARVFKGDYELRLRSGKLLRLSRRYTSELFALTGR